ncbi:MAG: imidazoleglycerol-phosphate dehydratase HisB [Desulfovibrio sp.]|nr:imidazoleglycerol-phosphate dehydratase HisB [Desulfovibrio sp.]
MSQRKTSLQRHSNETQIDVRLNLDGNGEARVITGFGMLDHMLELMAFWGNLDLEIQCNGDIHIDAHHTVEDCGLVFGSCILEALGDKRGIARSAFARVPMDEALAEVTVDLSGRPWLAWRGDELLPPVIAHEEKDVWREFYKAIASSARCNLHIDFLYGKNGHHLLESAAKGFGLALKKAVAIEDGKIKSTKGVLDK